MGETGLSYRRIAYRVGLVALLLLSACADNSGYGNSDHDKNSGFYGGVTGGGVRP